MSAGCCLTCTCFSNFVIQSCSSFRLSSLRATYLNDAGFNLKQCGDIYIVHRISHAKHLCTDPIRFPKLFIHFSPSKSGGRKKKRERVEQMASKWLKPPTMAPTTSSLSFSSHSPSFADYFFFSFFFCLLPSHRLDSAIAASSMPSRLTICAKEAQAHWKPHGANTKSAKRRKRGGRRGKEGGQEGEERWRRAQGLAELF